MPYNISQNNTNRQVKISHNATIEKKVGVCNIAHMDESLKDRKERVAERQRTAIKRVKDRYNLKNKPWCDKAGITEGALRGFLNGDANSMGSDNLELLADAIGITLAELLDSGWNQSGSQETDRVVKQMNTVFQKIGDRLVFIEDLILSNHVVKEKD